MKLSLQLMQICELGILMGIIKNALSQDFFERKFLIYKIFEIPLETLHA